MAWVQQTPFNEAVSGTTPGTAAPITGGQLSLTVGGGAAWSSSATGRRFDIQDNIAWSWIGGGTIDAWFHGSKTVAFEVVINDTLAATKTWFEATGTTGMASITYHAFGLTVSATGVVTVIFNIPGTGPTNMIVSSASVVTANTDTHAVVVYDTDAALSTDRIRLYINGSRITPATYTAPTAGLTLVWNQGTNAAFWVGGGTASAATINNYTCWFAAATHAPTDGEIATRSAALLAGNDAAPISDTNAYYLGSGTPVTLSTAQNPGYGPNLAGDLFMMQVYGRGTITTAPTTPSGWTEQSANPLTNQGQWIYTRDTRSTGGETGTVTIPSISVNGGEAVIHSFRNVATASFVEGLTVSSATGNSTTIPDQDVTASGNYRLAVGLVGRGSFTGTRVAWTGESGGNWISAFTDQTITGVDSGMQLQVASLDSGGTISGGSQTDGANDLYAVCGLALVGVGLVVAASPPPTWFSHRHRRVNSAYFNQ